MVIDDDWPLHTGQPIDVSDFTARVLAQLGARLQREPGSLRVELDPRQLAELEGRIPWPSPSAVGAPPCAALHLVFDPARQAADPQAELVTTGSARLEQLAAAALRAGRVGRGWLYLPGRRPVRYRPFLVFHFLVTCVGHEPCERLYSVAVDLVAGEAMPWPAGDTAWRLKAAGDGTPLEAPVLSLGEAHERATACLAHVIAAEEREWFAAARRWLQQELDNLTDYWRAAQADAGPELEVAQRARLAELEALARPHARARAEAATLLYMPLVHRAGESGHLYNPILGRPATDREPVRAGTAGNSRAAARSPQAVASSPSTKHPQPDNRTPNPSAK